VPNGDLERIADKAGNRTSAIYPNGITTAWACGQEKKRALARPLKLASWRVPIRR
jgi:hypothetical protein